MNFTEKFSTAERLLFLSNVDQSNKTVICISSLTCLSLTVTEYLSIYMFNKPGLKDGGFPIERARGTFSGSRADILNSDRHSTNDKQRQIMNTSGQHKIRIMKAIESSS